ncbi:MAG TPA: hypothetical protein VKU39_09910 [Streptosporangiaceae bacterium]|nr:hypothetical protein [Streptosporangiaceae bacterium]
MPIVMGAAFAVVLELALELPLAGGLAELLLLEHAAVAPTISAVAA